MLSLIMIERAPLLLNTSHSILTESSQLLVSFSCHWELQWIEWVGLNARVWTRLCFVPDILTLVWFPVIRSDRQTDAFIWTDRQTHHLDTVIRIYRQLIWWYLTEVFADCREGDIIANELARTIISITRHLNLLPSPHIVPLRQIRQTDRRTLQTLQTLQTQQT